MEQSEKSNREKEEYQHVSSHVIEINGLCKSFGTKIVLDGIDLTVFKGENLVVLGKSGSGKSILIKCIVGLCVPEKGEIKVFEKDITKIDETELNKIRLRIGFLFQNSALYDSMTLRENLAFTIQRHNKTISEENVNKEIEEILHSVGLDEAIDKMPSELSGGMRKRAGLARTLILKPEIILYDEPTTGLDSITSHEISDLILSIQKKYNTSSIIITHDMHCAKLTGDRLVVLKDGKIEAEGKYEVLENSDNEWIRSFFN
jgi:phospholipid/cholesterol/gamma-HCH transport system ATP-binding protein